MNNEYHACKQKLADKLDLPQDVVLGKSRITIQGDAEIFIENHRGLLQYTNKEIKVKTKLFVLQILGTNLYIQEYHNDVLLIKGKIEGMQFLT